jgi:tetratricopeptide (TPR) repeat protein
MDTSFSCGGLQMMRGWQLMITSVFIVLVSAGCKDPADTRVFNRVVGLLKSENDDERATGAELARRVKGHANRTKLIPMLIEKLEKGERNPWARIFASGSLTAITGRDFGSGNRDPSSWKKWWETDVNQKLPKKTENSKRMLETQRAQINNSQGEISLAGGATMNAVEHFRKAIALDGTKPLYHSNLGLALLKTGDHRGALNRFDDAISVDPEFTIAYMNKGATYADRVEKLRQAAKNIQAVYNDLMNRADDKRAAIVARDLVNVRKKIKNDEVMALDIFRRAIAIDLGGQLWGAHHQMGRIYMQRGDFEKALPPLEKAKKMRSQQIVVRRDLALTYYGLDQYYRSLLEIRAVEGFGGEMDKGFTKKVREKVQEMEKELK